MGQRTWERRKALKLYSQILPEEDSIHIAEMTAIKVTLKEIHKKVDKRWVIFTDSQSFVQFSEYNKENHPNTKPNVRILSYQEKY